MLKIRLFYGEQVRAGKKDKSKCLIFCVSRHFYVHGQKRGWLQLRPPRKCQLRVLGRCHNQSCFLFLFVMEFFIANYLPGTSFSSF